MAMVNYVATDFAYSILDNQEVMEMLCEDCPVCSRTEGCPVDYEIMNIHCPRKNQADNLISAIEDVLNEYGIY